MEGQCQETIYRILVVYRDNATLARIFLREAVGLDPDFAAAWESVTDQMVAIGAAILDGAIAKGVLPQQNSRVVAYCVVGMIERVAYHWLAQGVTDDLDELVDAVARFELFGIAGMPSTDG